MANAQLGANVKADIYLSLMFSRVVPYLRPFYKRLQQQKIKLTVPEKIQLTERFIDYCCNVYHVDHETLRNTLFHTPVKKPSMKVEYLAHAFSTTLQAMEGSLEWEVAINNWLLVKRAFELIEEE